MAGIISRSIECFQYYLKPKSYYENLLISNDDQFNEYIECIYIDTTEDNGENDHLVLEELRDDIFNLVCSIIIKKRDSFLINLDQVFNLRNVIRIRILFFAYFLVVNMVVFYLVPNNNGARSSFLESLRDSMWFSFVESVFVIVIDVVFYKFLYKSLRNRLNKYCYNIFDDDIKEYYDTRGESIFGRNFLTDVSDTDNGFKIQLFKDKLTSQMNSVCVLKPLTVSEEKIIMSIGFIGTLTDKKLKYTIFNKIIDTLEIELNLLKEAHINKQVEMEVICRGIDPDQINFLVKYKGFRRDRLVTHTFKFYKEFNKIRYVKRS